MDDKHKALSDVTATPTMSGLHGMSGAGPGTGGFIGIQGGMFSPPLWAQTPPMRGPSHGMVPGGMFTGDMMVSNGMTGVGFGTGGMPDGLSPALWLGDGAGMGSTRMTPLAQDSFSPLVYRSPNAELFFTPVLSGTTTTMTPRATQMCRKKALRNEFQNVKWNAAAEEKQIGAAPSAEATVLPSPLLDAAVNSMGNAKGFYQASPVPYMYQMSARQRLVPFESIKAQPMQPHMPAMTASYPMHQQPQEEVPVDLVVAQPKSELMYQHNDNTQMRHFPQPVPFHYGPPVQAMPHVKIEAMGVPHTVLPPTGGRIIAKKGAKESDDAAAEEGVVDKKLLKQIRSRAAASRQRSRQRDYLSKLMDSNVQLRQRVDVLLKQNERLKLDIRIGGQVPPKTEAVEANGTEAR